MAAKNGTTAVATGEPNDLYDQLSQDAKDEWDAIGALGFMPEKGMAGLWFARKPGAAAKDAIGPADSLQALHSIVTEKITPPEDDKVFDESDIDEIQDEITDNLDDPEMIELEDDGAGNKYLPGTGPKVIKALAFAIRTYDEIKLARVALSNREATAKKDLKLVLKKYERFLETDEETGEKFYVVGKIRGKIKIEEKEVFVTDHVAEGE
jgi:hypothetical protein